MFVSRLYDEIANMPDGAIRYISPQVRKDLLWWEQFLTKYNGVSMMWLDEAIGELTFTTDASLTGIGGKFWMNILNTK